MIGVRQQREIARPLDRDRELALVAGLGAGQARRHDLAVLRDVLLERVEILVVDRLHTLGGERAELLATEKSGHGLGSRLLGRFFGGLFAALVGITAGPARLRLL